jgi:hypothetical protein
MHLPLQIGYGNFQGAFLLGLEGRVAVGDVAGDAEGTRAGMVGCVGDAGSTLGWRLRFLLGRVESGSLVVEIWDDGVHRRFELRRVGHVCDEWWERAG